MAIEDFWFHNDDKAAGAITKKDALDAVKKSHLKDLVGPTSNAGALPSAYEVRKLIGKKSEEMERRKKIEAKPTTRERIMGTR